MFKDEMSKELNAADRMIWHVFFLKITCHKFHRTMKWFTSEITIMKRNGEPIIQNFTILYNVPYI